MISRPKTRVRSATKKTKTRRMTKKRTTKVSPKTNHKEKNLSRQLTALVEKAKTRQMLWLKL